MSDETPPVQVCDPVECAGALCNILGILHFMMLTKSLVATRDQHDYLSQMRAVAGMPCRSRAWPEPVPVPPEDWVGTPFTLWGEPYSSAGKAAIIALQKVLTLLPDPAEPVDDPKWRDYPWDKLLAHLHIFYPEGDGSLADLAKEAKRLKAAVENEWEATRREQAKACASAVREPQGADKPITLEEIEVRNIKTAFEKLTGERPEWSEQAILQAIAEKRSVSVRTIQRRIRELRKAGRLAPRPRKPKELSNRMTTINPTRD